MHVIYYVVLNPPDHPAIPNREATTSLSVSRPPHRSSGRPFSARTTAARSRHGIVDQVELSWAVFWDEARRSGFGGFWGGFWAGFGAVLERCLRRQRLLAVFWRL